MSNSIVKPPVYEDQFCAYCGRCIVNQQFLRLKYCPHLDCRKEVKLIAGKFNSHGLGMCVQCYRITHTSYPYCTNCGFANEARLRAQESMRLKRQLSEKDEVIEEKNKRIRQLEQQLSKPDTSKHTYSSQLHEVGSFINTVNVHSRSKDEGMAEKSPEDKDFEFPFDGEDDFMSQVSDLEKTVDSQCLDPLSANESPETSFSTECADKLPSDNVALDKMNEDPHLEKTADIECLDKLAKESPETSFTTESADKISADGVALDKMNEDPRDDNTSAGSGEYYTDDE